MADVTPGNPSLTDAPRKGRKQQPVVVDEGAAFAPPHIGGLKLDTNVAPENQLSEADKVELDEQIEEERVEGGDPGPEPMGTTKAPDFQPASIEIESLHVEGRVPAPIIKTKFWLGVMPDCPWWVVHAGGMDFPRFTEHLFEDAQGNTIREGRNGVVRDLSQEDVDKIKRDIQKIMVQKNGALTLQFHTDHEDRKSVV